MNNQSQLNLAKKAGLCTLSSRTYSTWLEEYERHIKTVKKPLPFNEFRADFTLLSALFDRDPEGKNHTLDITINILCNKLGF